MAFAQDLLAQAYHLARRERQRPRQASLRRAVSTSYYALFHFLLGQVTSNWRQENQRALLARYFKHGPMANASKNQHAACAKFLGANPAPGPETNCMTHLFTVSLGFHQAYQARETADYDNTRRWTRVQALAIIDQVDAAFKAWPQIRNHGLAQAYLLSLLGDPQGRK
jgi:uncharacterized protein (UPF0332 family)